MLYRALLLFLGLVLGQVQRHPARSPRPGRVSRTRGGCFFLCIRQLVCILWQAYLEVDGPVTRAFALVMGLIVLVNLLASSSALAGWATLFIVGASRGVTGPLRRGHPTAWRWQSRHAGRYQSQRPSTRPPTPPRWRCSPTGLRRQARDITAALRGGDPS